MNKVVAILEKNVEWVAIGLGTLFAMLMVYWYVVQTPITVTVGTSKVTPAQIDPLIVDGPVRSLNAAMNSTQKLDLQVKDFASDWLAKINGTSALASQGLTGPWVAALSATVETATPTNQPIGNNKPVALLPVLPAPENVGTSNGRSLVYIPPANADPNAAPVPGQGAVPADSQFDKNWTTVEVTIPVQGLVSAWTAANIQPNQAFPTRFLRIELEREELMADGTWENRVTVKPLANWAGLAYAGEPAEAAPGDIAATRNQVIYSQWADKSQKDILAPDFYPILQGDAWRAPHEPPPPPPPTVQPAAPPQPQPNTNKPNNRPQPAPQRPGGAGGQMSLGSHNPLDLTGGETPGALSQSQIQWSAPSLPLPGSATAQTPPPGYMPGRYATDVPPSGPMLPGPTPAASPAGQPSIDISTAIDITQGFDPLTLSGQGKIIIAWAHDDTAEPGKTYRYRIRYIMENPLKNTHNLAKNPKDADQYTLTSPFGPWTDPVNVRALTNFYAVVVKPNRSSVKFEIYKWQDGAQQQQKVDVSCGDMIGSLGTVNGKPIDFTTGWTLVDIRSDPRNADDHQVILVDQDGRQSIHNVLVDMKDPHLSELRAIVAAPQPAQPLTVMPTNPGTPPSQMGPPPGSPMAPPGPRGPRLPNGLPPNAGPQMN